jgi:23S rRNA A2030 N6-methylase RlmJ
MAHPAVSIAAMFSYRHAFHAGNHADVLKHITLLALLKYLTQKEALTVIDTHAGMGRYDLTGEIAKRSPEYKDGIGRLLTSTLPQKAAPLVAPYLDVIRELNPGERLETYPGSPLLVRKLLLSLEIFVMQLTVKKLSKLEWILVEDKLMCLLISLV